MNLEKYSDCFVRYHANNKDFYLYVKAVTDTSLIGPAFIFSHNSDKVTFRKSEDMRIENEDDLYRITQTEFMFEAQAAVKDFLKFIK